MASRRRLDISSLLCNNDEASVNRQDSHASRSPVRPPTQQRQQVQTAPGHPYLSSEHNTSAFAPTTSPHNSPQYERVQQHQHQRQPSPTVHGSPGSLPSAAVLTPLAFQPSPPRQRTPSPPFALLSTSPVDRSGPLGPGRRSGDLRVSVFPRPASYTAQGHLHQYTQYPLPPSSTSPVNAREASSGRRASIQLRPHQHPPTLQTPPSPSSPSSLPSKFPSSAHRSSFSPTELPLSVRASTSNASETYSPPLPRSPEPKMHSSQRTSASLSPTVPTTGLSSLDVLVQAATEERERIDVHRRQSGGEERQPSFNFNIAIPASLSPVEFRHISKLQAPTPTLLYTASSQTSHYMAVDQADVHYKEQGFKDDERTGTRHRPSSEPSHSPQLDTSQASHHGSILEFPAASSTLEGRSRSPEAGYDRRSFEVVGSSHLPSTCAGRALSKPGSLYVQSSSSCSTAHHAAFEEAHMISPSPHLLFPIETVAVRQARRSPPRSRPKPKKPGSAALAIMEKEFRDVVLSDRDRNMLIEGRGASSASKHTPEVSPSRQTQARPFYVSSNSLQSNERGAVDDEDVDDFFFSTFDSPKNAERQIPAQIDRSNDSPSVQTTDETSFPQARGADSFLRHTILTQSAKPATDSRGTSPEATGECVDQFSPVRRIPEVGNEGMMSEVEAEILDELADAAGAVTSEDERTEFDDQETDNMEVDVENELLSLIDGPSDVPSRSHHHSPSSYGWRSSALAQHAGFDRMYMPLPDALKATTGVQTEDSKKSSSKPKARAKADDASKPDKLASVHVGDLAAKPPKSKSGSKPRPTKGVPADKMKSGKLAKDASTPASPSLPTPSMSLPSSTSPTDQAFPMVTSSGRMVTKSKKSAAAAAAASTVPTSQLSSSHVRKKPAITMGGGDGSASGSRSHSVMPRASADPEVHRARDAEERLKDAAAEEADEGDKDKLYCICRTQYDEDRVMIACDRCDEWYHTQCVNMPDLLIDLVDQFICSNCISRSPGLNLRTTYKQRCFAGLKHPNPDSPDACHKPSRGAYSKYCSDECGVRYMHCKIQVWAGNGGDVRGLWESVKHAKRREGYVIREPGRTLLEPIVAEIQKGIVPKAQVNVADVIQLVADEEGRNSIVARLEEQLQTVVREREELKKELEVTSWRERLLQLASDRAENMGDCGWDQRLVYGDEEWLEFGAGVLESYEDTAPNGHSAEENHEMDVDGQSQVGEWWCHGKKKCERHMGWQRVRAADIEKERTTKEKALADLTTREREIRSRIEDIIHPQSRPAAGSFIESTFKFKLPTASLDGAAKRAKKKVATVV